MAVAARAIHIIQRVVRERRNITQETGAARTLLDGRAGRCYLRPIGRRAAAFVRGGGASEHIRRRDQAAARRGRPGARPVPVDHPHGPGRGRGVLHHLCVTYAGGATPLAVLLALVACLFVAISIGQLARHLPSAGGLYTYSARGLHPTVGFFVAWGFMLAEPLVAPLLYLIFGNVIGVFLTNHFNTPTWLWAPFAALAGIGVWALVFRGV